MGDVSHVSRWLFAVDVNRVIPDHKVAPTLEIVGVYATWCSRIVLISQNKTHMSAILRLLPLWEAIAKNTELSVYVDKRDLDLVRRRALAEGLDFLTVTLPKLGKAVDRSFESGQLLIPDGFKRVDGQSVPVFLKKAFAVLYDETGKLRWYENSPNGLFNVPDFDGTYANAAKCIRQLTLMFYKLRTTFTDHQIAEVVDRFERTDDEIGDLRPDVNQLIGGVSLDSVLTRARHAIGIVLGGFDPLDIGPRHGSGAAACGTKPWNRYKAPRYIPRLANVYAYDLYFYTPTGFVDDLDKYLAAEDYEPCAKVVLVPKDSRGPRLISEEPRETMYIQQGQMAKLYEAIEARLGARSMVSCIDQTRNRRLAQFASQTGSYATIDMKDASDRISTWLVERLFPSNWVEALMASRSQWTQLPGGRIRPLKKFAPMGSATCFPVEALCFWALSIAACGPKDLVRVIKSTPTDLPVVAVFGDDIICPTGSVQNVMSVLEAVGLKVNPSKCYTRGPFRESCGGDYFLGNDISVVKVNHLIHLPPGAEPAGKTNSIDDIHYSMFRLAGEINNLIARFGAYEWLVDSLVAIYNSYYGPIPILSSKGNCLSDEASSSKGLVIYGRNESLPPMQQVHRSRKKPKLYQTRMHPRYFRREVYTLLEMPVDRKIDTSDWSHVLRSLLNQGGLKGTSVVTLAKRHQYKYGWVAM